MPTHPKNRTEHKIGRMERCPETKCPFIQMSPAESHTDTDTDTDTDTHTDTHTHTDKALIVNNHYVPCVHNDWLIMTIMGIETWIALDPPRN